MQTASEIGLPVARHPPVIGFDDSSPAVRMRPALTTVRQDVVGKGRIAALALTVAIGQSRSDVAARTRHVMRPTQPRVRDSTAPVLVGGPCRRSRHPPGGDYAFPRSGP